ncbi:MAG TPA: tetratricopeptide repeat protein [Bryobacteraceae bacterium]|nr:tetratricopeptide repeat protein [Bryobacteraceae bacterium]
MSLSRTVILFVAFAPLTFGASKEIVELQRDVSMLQDQVQKMQAALNDKLTSLQALVQQTTDYSKNTDRALAVMQDRFNDAMKQQQASVSAPVASVGQKLDQMAEDFRAVRESVLDMNTRMGKLDAKMADLQNLINTIKAPAPPPPGATSPSGAPGAPQAAQAGPPPGMEASTAYTNAYRDYLGGKYDLAMPEFNDYLKYFSNTQFASNVQFYIGDIYFKKQDYTNALQAFDNVLERFPDGNKTADAHYMKGMALMQLGRNDSAAREFRDVYTSYPDTDLAAKAKARLKELGLNVGTTNTRAKRR